MRRGVRLLAGLVLFGCSLALLLRAGLGVDPWTVLSQGISERTGLSIGTITVIVSLLLLLAWFPLHQRPGPGTVANALVVGPVIDAGLAVIPSAPSPVWGLLFVGAAVLGTAIATGLYVGAGWGPGPRDGIMTGLAARGVPLPVARAGIELTVLALGWLLGGSVGLGTVVYAVAIGPLVGFWLPRLRVDR